MGTKSPASRFWMAALALGLLFVTVPGLAQTSSKPPLSSIVPAGTTVLLTPATPPRRTVPAASRPMTPFERVIAPHLTELMRQSAVSKSARARPHARPAASGVNGSSVNFPGFTSVPFLTINDGDTTSIANAVSGDFNHDGLMDVATINLDGTINVILNPGTFANIQSLAPITSNNDGNPGQLYIMYATVADMNGDGFPDLIGQDIENNAVVVWLGKGNGAFGPPTSYPVTLKDGAQWYFNAGGGSILVGDFNEDGSPDVATLTYDPVYKMGASTTIVTELTLLNNGKGVLIPAAETDSTFQDYYFSQFGDASITTADGVTPSGLAFLINDQSTNPPYANGGSSIVTMASNGDGTFAKAIEPTSPLVQDNSLSTDSSVVSTNLSSSTGNQTATTDIVFITGDGAVYDAPFTSGNPTQANVLVGVNTELFAFGDVFVPPVTAPPTPPSLISTPLPSELTLNVADMNGDGLQDLIVYTFGGVTIFPNAGNGIFTAAPTQMAGATAFVQQPQPAAYDSGKYNSLVNVDFALGQVGYFQNLGAEASVQAGQFVAAPLITGTNTTGNIETFGTNLEVVATADIDGDGIPDLIGLDVSNIANGPADVVVGFRNGSLAGNQSSNYTFKTAITGQSLYNISNGLEFVEPVVISNAIGTSIILVTRAAGPFIATAGKDGVFGAPAALDLGGSFNCSVNFADVGDVNGDGIPDIVFAYGGDGACGGSGTPSGFITLLGNADGTFKPGIFSPLGKALYQVKLINFSGKAGNLDIAALDQSFLSGAMGAFVVPNKGDGSGTFDLTKASEPVNNYIISDIVPGDYNSDGKQDLTLLTEGQYSSSTSTIVPNTSGVLLLPGNGDYTFGTPTLVNPGQYAQWGSYADFNADGNPDLALSEFYNIFIEQTSTPRVVILPNLGGGAFGDPITEFSSFTQANTQGAFSSDYTFTGNFTNSGGPDLLVAGVNGTAEFVNRGVTALALTASSSAPGQDTPVTFTAKISQAVSAGVDETGSVSFSANGTLLGASPVNDGVATFATSALAVGSNLITATYAGDANHNQATASLTVTVATVAPAFILTPPKAALSLAQGATGTVLVSVAGNSTFSGVVTLTCTGAPAEASCASSPESVTLAPGQSAGVSIVIATTPPNNTYQAKTTRTIPPITGTLGGLSLAGLLFLLLPSRRRFSRILALLAIAVVALASAATLTGCSGGGSKNQYAGTVPGAYSLTVTATSGGLTQTQAIALTVTAAAK